MATLISSNQKTNEYICNICGARFLTFFELNQHMFGKHKDYVDYEFYVIGKGDENMFRALHENADIDKLREFFSTQVVKEVEEKKESAEEVKQEVVERKIGIKLPNQKKYTYFDSYEQAFDFVVNVFTRAMKFNTPEEMLVQFLKDNYPNVKKEEVAKWRAKDWLYKFAEVGIIKIKE